MELTDNDRQRIEQANRNEFMPYKAGWIAGAEYATIYEREQQIESDDSDIRKTWLTGFFGGNGDIYIKIISENKEGLKDSHCVRIATSGGNAPLEVKLACADLVRAMNGNTIQQDEAERSELMEYNNNLEKALRICLTVKPHTESVDAMKAMIKTLIDNSLKTK